MVAHLMIITFSGPYDCDKSNHAQITYPRQIDCQMSYYLVADIFNECEKEKGNIYMLYK